MRVVSNTSPLCNLAIIGRLSLLKDRYTTVTIPVAVHRELEALSHPLGRSQIQRALVDGWIVIAEPTLNPAVGSLHLDPGEMEAIQLALNLSADMLLIDERRGRQEARKLHIPVSGILGELLHAKGTGCLASVRVELTRLKDEAGFFLSDEMQMFVLTQAGEL